MASGGTRLHQKAFFAYFNHEPFLFLLYVNNSAKKCRFNRMKKQGQKIFHTRFPLPLCIMKSYLNNQTCKNQLSRSPAVTRQAELLRSPPKVAFCPANPFLFMASREKTLLLKSLLALGDNSYGDLASGN